MESGRGRGMQAVVLTYKAGMLSWTCGGFVPASKVEGRLLGLVLHHFERAQTRDQGWIFGSVNRLRNRH